MFVRLSIESSSERSGRSPSKSQSFLAMGWCFLCPFLYSYRQRFCSKLSKRYLSIYHYLTLCSLINSPLEQL